MASLVPASCDPSSSCSRTTSRDVSLLRGHQTALAAVLSTERRCRRASLSQSLVVTELRCHRASLSHGAAETLLPLGTELAVGCSARSRRIPATYPCWNGAGVHRTPT